MQKFSSFLDYFSSAYFQMHFLSWAFQSTPKYASNILLIVIIVIFAVSIQNSFNHIYWVHFLYTRMGWSVIKPIRQKIAIPIFTISFSCPTKKWKRQNLSSEKRSSENQIHNKFRKFFEKEDPIKKLVKQIDSRTFFSKEKKDQNLQSNFSRVLNIKGSWKRGYSSADFPFVNWSPKGSQKKRRIRNSPFAKNAPSTS